MHRIVISVPFAIVVSLALVALGAIVATAPSTAGSWASVALAAASLFTAIMYVGAAFRHRRRHH